MHLRTTFILLLILPLMLSLSKGIRYLGTGSAKRLTDQNARPELRIHEKNVMRNKIQEFVEAYRGNMHARHRSYVHISGA